MIFCGDCGLVVFSISNSCLVKNPTLEICNYSTPFSMMALIDQDNKKYVPSLRDCRSTNHQIIGYTCEVIDGQLILAL